MEQSLYLMLDSRGTPIARGRIVLSPTFAGSRILVSFAARRKNAEARQANTTAPAKLATSR